MWCAATCNLWIPKSLFSREAPFRRLAHSFKVSFLKPSVEEYRDASPGKVKKGRSGKDAYTHFTMAVLSKHKQNWKIGGNKNIKIKCMLRWWNIAYLFQLNILKYWWLKKGLSTLVNEAATSQKSPWCTKNHLYVEKLSKLVCLHISDIVSFHWCTGTWQEQKYMNCKNNLSVHSPAPICWHLSMYSPISTLHQGTSWQSWQCYHRTSHSLNDGILKEPLLPLVLERCVVPYIYKSTATQIGILEKDTKNIQNKKDVSAPNFGHDLSCWFQPNWKICSSNWIPFLQVVVKISKWNHHL